MKSAAGVRDARRASVHKAVITVAVGLVVLAGCSGGPSPSTDAGATSRGAQSTRAGRPGVWHPTEPDTLGPVVAVIGGTKLKRHDVDSVIATAPPDLQERLRTFDGYRQLVERLTMEETLVQAADRAGVEDDPAYRQEMARAERSAKMRTFYNKRLAAAPMPPDSALLAYYEQHRDDYKIPARARVRHIQLATQADAKAVRRSLDKGALWDETTKKKSRDTMTKDRGGLIGYVSQESDVVPGIGKAPAVVRAVFDLKDGEISQPVKSEKGWHILRADNHEAASVQSFDQVKGQIRNSLEAKAVDAFSAAFTESLRTAAGAAIFDDSIRVALEPARTPQEYFKDAQAAVTAQDRIQLYRQLVKRFPQDSVSIQARFMIGFTYAEDLGDYENAKKEFEEFLRLHPGSELVPSARWMLENMEKPPPPMEEDDAPADSTSVPSETGGGKAPEPARYSP